MLGYYSNCYSKVNSNYYLSGYSARYNLDEMSTIGDRVRIARKARGISQKDLADRIGIRQPTLSNLEGGRNTSSVKISSLALELRVNPVWLETGEGDMELAEGQFAVISDTTSDLPKELEPLRRKLMRAWASQSLNPASIKALEALVDSLPAGAAKPKSMKGTPEQEEAQRAASQRLADKLKSSNLQFDQDKDDDISQH